MSTDFDAKFSELRARLIAPGDHRGALLFVYDPDDKLQKLLDGNDRDYSIWVPWKSTDEQPSGWCPDINDGVRVNIAPLQRSGLLAAGVLSAKDMKSLLASEGR